MQARTLTRDQVWCGLCLAALCAAVLVYTPRAVPLFEPDEGRNAEIGREILQLGDWITPHFDFIPYLDKPMGLYWLIAISFRLFGVSEWAARLPSALAAVGCVALACEIARARSGLTAALWTGLILVSSPLFALFSRATIFDMPLTFCVALALWAATRAMDRPPEARGPWLVTMCAAMACATLVKGPVGLLLPAATIVIHGLLTRRLSWSSHRGLAAGAAVYLLLVVSWYAAAEVRNPGYLRYFLIEEHVARFMTTRFQREAPWYFYAGVLAAGVFPWTGVLVALGSRAREAWRDERTIFLYVWAVVPIVAFSLSQSKLPGYILPSLPPLAILMGEEAARRLDAGGRARWPIVVAAAALLVATSAVGLVVLHPDAAPAGLLSGSVAEVLPAIRTTVAYAMPFVAVLLVLGVAASFGGGRAAPYVAACAGLAAIYSLAATVETPVAESRSSRILAQRVAAELRTGDQLVIYDDYFASLPFYLRIDRPIWVVWFGRRGEVLGSPYVAEKRPRPAVGHGVAWMTGTEFEDAWARGDTRLLVLVGTDKLDRLTKEVGAAPNILFSVDGASLVVKP